MLLYGGVFFPARLVPTTVSVYRLDRSESDNEPLRESKRYRVNWLGPTNSRDEVLQVHHGLLSDSWMDSLLCFVVRDAFS